MAEILSFPILHRRRTKAYRFAKFVAAHVMMRVSEHGHSPDANFINHRSRMISEVMLANNPEIFDGKCDRELEDSAIEFSIAGWKDYF